MKKLVFLAAVLASVAFAGAPASQVPTDAQAYKMNKWMGPVALDVSLGTKLQQAHNTAVGIYSFANTGGAVGSHAVGITLPDNAIVKKAWYDVLTQPVGVSGEVGFQVQGSYDLKASTGVASWTGLVDGALDGAVANFVKLTASRPVYAVVSGAALTAGKIKVYVDYVLSE